MKQFQLAALLSQFCMICLYFRLFTYVLFLFPFLSSPIKKILYGEYYNMVSSTNSASLVSFYENKLMKVGNPECGVPFNGSERELQSISNEVVSCESSSGVKRIKMFNVLNFKARCQLSNKVKSSSYVRLNGKPFPIVLKGIYAFTLGDDGDYLQIQFTSNINYTSYLASAVYSIDEGTTALNPVFDGLLFSSREEHSAQIIPKKRRTCQVPTLHTKFENLETMSALFNNMEESNFPLQVLTR